MILSQEMYSLIPLGTMWVLLSALCIPSFCFDFFSPYDFGVLSILLAISYLFANIFSFGIPATLYAHIPKLMPDKQKAYDFLKSNFLFQTALALIGLGMLYVLLPHIDARFFKLNLPHYYYGLTVLSTLLYIWQNFVRDSLNAAERFMHINIATTVSSVVRIVLIVVCGYFGVLTIPLTIIILGIVAPAVVFIMVLPQRIAVVQSLIRHSVERGHIKLSFTLPYFISTQLFNLTTRADLFLVAYYLTTVDAGQYSVAQRVIFVIITSIDSITQVLSAEYAKITTREEIIRLIKKSFKYMAIPSAVLVMFALTPAALYAVFIPKAYMPSVPIIKLLSLAYIPFAFDAALLLFFLYTLKKPMFVLYVNIIMLALVTTLHVIFIPQLGMQGPVVSFGLTYLVVTIVIGLNLLRELRLLKH
ncbi:MAG: Polysaccharide biosynthesis protein [Microgenomates bacterium OLB23]|nr:MAG: Polysaccharide biosynthesis protein [Microgenomates bacterium OLB23]